VRGHIVDLPAPGRHWFTPHCLVKTVGRSSGRTYVTPLIYGCRGGELIVAASNGGSEAHPAWYLNIKSMGAVELQVATEAFSAEWRELSGDQREATWQFMLDIFPGYADYQSNTRRIIPLIALRPVARAETFSRELSPKGSA
jgi:deazaflavin-dependent oxidoreductase (nitroreductase family)